jgi:diguanylate cyclase (GGDEF)-like protein
MTPRLSSRQIIIAGFAGVAVFMVGMLGIGLARLSEINGQMDELANRTFRRAEAVYTMRMVARDRLVGLQSMFFLSDPFERDAEWMRYGGEALRFIEARDTFLALAPTAAQRAIWEETRMLIATDEALHAQAVDLIFADRRAEASLLIQQKIIPLEARLLERLDTMLGIERSETQRRLAEANRRYRETFALMLLLALATLAVTAATAVYVTRRSARNEAMLLQEKRRAEDAAEQLAWAAAHDALTGLPNRRVFEATLAALLRSAREEGAHHTLAYLDLDRFKQVNDRHGHEAGDQLLVAVARLMRDRIGPDDTLARLGGDEFGLLLPHCDLAQGERVVRGLRQSIKAFSLPWGSRALSVGLSAGLVAVDAAAADGAELVHRADMACYASKSRRRASADPSGTD